MDDTARAFWAQQWGTSQVDGSGRSGLELDRSRLDALTCGGRQHKS